MSKSTLKPTEDDRASMWKKRTASERAFSMSMRLAYRMMSCRAEELASLVSRMVGLSWPSSLTKSWRKLRLRGRAFCSKTRGVRYLRWGRSRLTVRQAEGGRVSISASRRGERRRRVMKEIPASRDDRGGRRW